MNRVVQGTASTILYMYEGSYAKKLVFHAINLIHARRLNNHRNYGTINKIAAVINRYSKNWLTIVFHL